MALLCAFNVFWKKKIVLSNNPLMVYTLMRRRKNAPKKPEENWRNLKNNKVFISDMHVK